MISTGPSSWTRDSPAALRAARLRSLDPRNTQLLADRAAEYFKVRRIDLAIDDRTTAIGLEPKVAEHHDSRGRLYLRNNAYVRAITDFDAAIRLEPRAAYFLNRGDAYSLKGDHRRRIADFDEAVRLDRTLARAYNTRGMAWKFLGDRSRALADFKAAVELCSPTLKSRFCIVGKWKALAPVWRMAPAVS